MFVRSAIFFFFLVLNIVYYIYDIVVRKEKFNFITSNKSNCHTTHFMLLGGKCLHNVMRMIFQCFRSYL